MVVLFIADVAGDLTTAFQGATNLVVATMSNGFYFGVGIITVVLAFLLAAAVASRFVGQFE